MLPKTEITLSPTANHQAVRNPLNIKAEVTSRNNPAINTKLFEKLTKSTSK